MTSGKEPTFIDRFGARIAQLRKRSALTQKELAAKLTEKSWETVAKWEQGRQAPRVAELEELADALQVSVAEIFDDREDHRIAVRDNMLAARAAIDAYMSDYLGDGLRGEVLSQDPERPGRFAGPVHTDPDYVGDGVVLEAKAVVGGAEPVGAVARSPRRARILSIADALARLGSTKAMRDFMVQVERFRASPDAAPPDLDVAAAFIVELQQKVVEVLHAPRDSDGPS